MELKQRLDAEKDTRRDIPAGLPNMPAGLPYIPAGALAGGNIGAGAMPMLEGATLPPGMAAKMKEQMAAAQAMVAEQGATPESAGAPIGTRHGQAHASPETRRRSPAPKSTSWVTSWSAYPPPCQSAPPNASPVI